MAASTVLVAKRALVRLLLRLAVAYHVVISVNRDSEDRLVTAAYKKVILKAHPDKGGSKIAQCRYKSFWFLRVGVWSVEWVGRGKGRGGEIWLGD